MDLNTLGERVAGRGNPKFIQSGDHYFRIPTKETVLQTARPFSKGGEKERSVCDALRAWNGYRGARGNREYRNWVRILHSIAALAWAWRRADLGMLFRRPTFLELRNLPRWRCSFESVEAHLGRRL